MATKSKRHVHKYHRIQLAGEMLWACALPTCNHHMPKHYENTIPGKASFCWQCGEQFILDLDNMKLDEPICFDCLHPEFSSENEVIGKMDIVSEFLKQKAVNK